MLMPSVLAHCCALCVSFGFIASSAGLLRSAYAANDEPRPAPLVLPDITLTAEELAKLCGDPRNDPVIRMLPAAGGREAAWMVYSVDASVPTVWQVVTNVRNFHLEDPAFPETSGRHTFMPYVQYANTCDDGDSIRVFQYLNLPTVADRKYTVVRRHRNADLPWEVRWDTDPQMSCQGSPPAEHKQAIEAAVRIRINRGVWRLFPRSSFCSGEEANRSRTVVLYYVDADPGGIVGAIGLLARLAQRRALPQVAKNVRFHASRWQQYLTDHEGPQAREALEELDSKYRQEMLRVGQPVP